MNHPGLNLLSRSPHLPAGFYIVDNTTNPYNPPPARLTLATILQYRDVYFLGEVPVLYDPLPGPRAWQVVRAFRDGQPLTGSGGHIYVEGRWPMLWYEGSE